MKMDKIFAIGLMSGTSLDGLDICYAAFAQKQDSTWSFEILQAETVSFPEVWETKLRTSTGISGADLFALNAEYGFYIGAHVKDFIEKHQLQRIDVIASHGHTVYHQPERGFTVQIGDGRAIKIRNNFPVVYDFRSQDVLLGGNGAPLVPIGDQLLFGEYDACLNLGGFSNISTQSNAKRIAYDICPVNIVLNHHAKKLGKKYDEDGKLAESGSIDTEVLEKLNNLAFYAQKGPKSLGTEWLEKKVEPLLRNLDPETAMATFTEHAAEKIALEFSDLEMSNVLITGGGAYNNYLIRRISEKSGANIIIPDASIIEYKEALIFAFMGVLRIKNINNVLSSATGASHDHCTGLLI